MTKEKDRSAKDRETKDRSAPHIRTRDDHATETAEDYVEAVADIIAERGECRVGNLAKHFNVSHVTVSRIVSRLVSEDLLKTEPYRPIELTKAGKKLADRVRHRHQVVLEFLIAIGVDSKTAAIDSEGIEHHVSPKTLTAMKKFLKENCLN